MQYLHGPLAVSCCVSGSAPAHVYSQMRALWASATVPGHSKHYHLPGSMRTYHCLAILALFLISTGCGGRASNPVDEAEQLEFCKKVADIITSSDPTCGRYFDQIRAENVRSDGDESPMASRASTDTMQTRERPPVLSRESNLERRAVDEIERFEKWSGEGPAPQPIRAMEDMWRCNKFGDC
jgi:hypothetical protein